MSSFNYRKTRRLHRFICSYQAELGRLGRFPVQMSQSAKKAGKAAASSTIPKRKDQPDAQDLTFGIELEYVFVFLKNHPDRLKFGDIIPEAWAVRWIEHAFDEDLEAKCKACRATVRFPLDIASDYGVLGIPFRVDYERWHVKRETVKMTPEEKDVLKVSRDEYETYGIEITSRILSAGSDLIVSDMKCSDHDHQIGFQDEIRAVVERLKDRFCSFGGSRARWDYLYPVSVAVLSLIGQESRNLRTS